ncbi:MAG: copper chaperone PCu(A)C [Gammaproteobacteria bacterium]|nr:MAG: copper chaperone PCu(A)C [Gammaproteobacteria bacterium]
MKRLLLAFGLLVAFPLWAVEVEHPWIPEAPPNAKVLAGYMTLVNTGDAPEVLTGVESPLFQRVEMHRMVMEKGMARMEPLK